MERALRAAQFARNRSTFPSPLGEEVMESPAAFQQGDSSYCFHPR